MASAATMNVYIREWTQGNTSNTYLGTPNPNPNGLSSPAFTVTGVNSNGTYKDALELAETGESRRCMGQKKSRIPDCALKRKAMFYIQKPMTAKIRILFMMDKQ